MRDALGIVAAKEADFMIHSLLRFELFGQELYLTTTHVSILIVCLGLIIFAFVARLKLKDTDGKPGGFQNAVEYVVETLDGMVKSGMGKKGIPYRNYIGTLFLFILFSNLSGLVGLRPPTADYGVTFPLGVITFFLIQFNLIPDQFDWGDCGSVFVVTSSFWKRLVGNGYYGAIVWFAFADCHYMARLSTRLF